jgi:hypothetical protein
LSVLIALTSTIAAWLGDAEALPLNRAYGG